MKLHQKFEIQWNDTFSNEGWWTKKGLELMRQNMDYLITTVGYYVSEDKMFITLAMSIAPTKASYGMLKHIPKGCIVKIKKFN